MEIVDDHQNLWFDVKIVIGDKIVLVVKVVVSDLIVKNVIGKSGFHLGGGWHILPPEQVGVSQGEQGLRNVQIIEK